ncbi:MAG: HPr family phosphocarrier protein [bacterium]|nr:MAG: HPr family phosphocarrier protein [bacterium]
MVSAEVTIRNRLGMHARAAAIFVRQTTNYDGEVWLTKGKNRVNGKSIMGILTLAAARGEMVLIEVEGPGEEETLRTLVDIVDGRFGEVD